MAKKPIQNRFVSDGQIACTVVNIKNRVKSGILKHSSKYRGDEDVISNMSERLKEACIDAGLKVESWALNRVCDSDASSEKLCPATEASEAHWRLNISLFK